MQPDLGHFFAEIQTKTCADGMSLEIGVSTHEPKTSQRGKTADPGAAVSISKQAIALFLKQKRLSNKLRSNIVDDEVKRQRKFDREMHKRKMMI